MKMSAMLKLFGLENCYRQHYCPINDRTQSFVQLAKHGRFDDINDILLSHNDDDIKLWLKSAVSNNSTSNHRYHYQLQDDNNKTNKSDCRHNNKNKPISGEHTFLHILVYYRPPVSTINILCDWMGKNIPGYIPEDSLDRNGQNPLHIAVRSGCDICVIQRLANVPYPATALPARALDNMNRCALHWACCIDQTVLSRNTVSGHVTIEFRNRMVAIVQLLTNSYPQAALIEDIDQKTPLELAIDNKLDKRILLALLKVSNAIIKDASPLYSNNGTTHEGRTESLSGLSSAFEDDLDLDSKDLWSMSERVDLSYYPIPRVIMRQQQSIRRSRLLSADDCDSLSDMSDCGASTYNPDRAQHEASREFICV